MDSYEAFDHIVSNSSYPMYIVTATGEHRAGCLVGFASQASITPRRFLVMLSKANHTYRVAQRVHHLAVHFLGAADRDLAALFGEETGDDTDKFARCEWQVGPEGTTIVPASCGWAVGRIIERVDTGDHVGHLMELVEARVGRDGPPLTSRHVSDMEPGHPA